MSADEIVKWILGCANFRLTDVSRQFLDPTERIEKFDPTIQLENKYSVVASRADFRKSWHRESMDDCIRGCRRVNGINREARFREVRWLRASTPWKMFGTAVRIISNFQPEWIGWFCSNNFRGNNFVPIISLSARCDGDQFPKQLIVFRYDNRSRSDTVQRFIADVFHFNLECPSECESNRTGEPILPRFEERKTAIQHCRASEISLPSPSPPLPPVFSILADPFIDLFRDGRIFIFYETYSLGSFV